MAFFSRDRSAPSTVRPRTTPTVQTGTPEPTAVREPDGWRPWVDVVSSNVRCFRYHDEAALLEIQFIGDADKKALATRRTFRAPHPRTSGSRAGDPIYIYERVPAHLVEAFERAPSKGQFVWRFIRDQFDYSGPRFA